MKNTCLILLFFLSINCFSQKDETSNKETIRKDSTIIIYGKQINNIINNQFSQFVTGQAKASLNNYVSVDPKDASLNFNGVIQLGKNRDSVNSYLSINTNGGYSDGISTLFNNSKLSSNVSAELRLHKLGKKWNMTLSGINMGQYRREKQRIESVYKVKSDSIVISYQIAQNKIQKLKTLKAKRDSISIVINTKKNILQTHDVLLKNRKVFNNPLSDEAEKLIRKNKIDSLCDVLETLKKQCKSCFIDSTILKNPCEISDFKDENKMIFKMDSLLRRTEKAIYKYPIDYRIDTLSLVGISIILASNQKEMQKSINEIQVLDADKLTISWHSYSFRAYNNNFNLFDGSKSFNDQITKKNFTGYAFSYEYNRFGRSKSDNQFFTSINISAFSTDNLNKLESKIIKENKRYVKDSTQERNLTKDVKVLVGDYQTKIFGLKFNYDYYNLFFKDFGGLHFFPEATFIQKEKPVINLGVGIFLRFLKKDDVKSNVNAELYTKFNNVTNNKDALFDKIESGIRLSFPIYFKNFNN
jgi:hypothetical protein